MRLEAPQSCLPDWPGSRIPTAGCTREMPGGAATDGGEAVFIDRTESRSPVASGAVSGAVTVLGFTLLHQVLISDIWFSFVAMLFAGVACGATLAWSYDRQFPRPTPRQWWGFVVMHTALLLALGGVSVAIFDPAVPMAALLAANEPPAELIAQAMPLTVGWIVIAAALPSLLWGRSLKGLAANSLTSTLLVLLLGLNVSVLGLVEMSGGPPFVVLEFFALLVVIMLGYGATFRFLERRGLFRQASLRGGLGPG